MGMFDGPYSLEGRGSIGKNIWEELDDDIMFKDSDGPQILQYKWEFEKLLDIYAELADHGPINVLEIGSYKGGSLYQWMKAADSESYFISISADADDHDLLRKMMAWADQWQQVIYITTVDSHEPGIVTLVRDLLAGSQLDFLFIDGDHSYEGSKADFENYGPLVRPGGLIVLQDILFAARHPECRVDLLWRDIKWAGYKTQEFYTSPEQSGLGIGVVYV